MQPGERKLHLGLDARGPRHAEHRPARGEVLEQRGLANASLATQDEDSAMARGAVVDHLIEDSHSLRRPLSGDPGSRVDETPPAQVYFALLGLATAAAGHVADDHPLHVDCR